MDSTKRQVIRVSGAILATTRELSIRRDRIRLATTEGIECVVRLERTGSRLRI